MSFSQMKKTRAASIGKLVQAAEKAGGGDKPRGDDAMWNVARDKADNGYAVVRLLPAGAGEDLPWVQFWDHAFKGDSGKWLIEKCPTTIGQQCPVCDENTRLWNTGLDDDKAIVRKRKRGLHYVVNVYVISDPANPQNEGKVLKYKFGKKIFDKIMDVMQPQFQDEEPVNPFDFWAGADLKIKVRRVDGWVNYDKSEFASPSPFMDGDDAKLEEVYNQLHALNEYTNVDNFKSFDELAKLLARATGESAPMTTAESISLDEPVSEPAPAKTQKAKEAPKQAAASAKAESEDDEEMLSYFARLAADE